MKYIKKNQKIPTLLLEHLDFIKNNNLSIDFESLGGDAKKEIQESLLEEQAYLCAYCMQRITNEIDKKITIEHFLSQQLHPKKALDYSNMIGVCKGGTHPQLHCDKTQNGKVDGNVILNKLNPLDKNCEKLIDYTKNGLILSKINDEDVEQDINDYLNLNVKSLQEMRETALNTIWELFKKKYEDKKNWTKKIFDDEIQNLKTSKNGKFKPFVNFLIWFFEQKKEKYK